MEYADILVHHAYARTQSSLTYSVPQGMELFEGSGVVVPFQRGQKPGLILKLHSKQPDFKTREIQSILDPNPLLRTWQLNLSEWICEYYFCSNYDALKLFLPQDIWRAPKATRKSATKEKILEPKSKLTLTPIKKPLCSIF
jgi:primosomal protein N'